MPCIPRPGARTAFLLSFCVALGLLGCNSAKPPSATGDTRAADEAAIRQRDADWVKAAQSKQVDAWTAFYSDDAVVLAPNYPVADNKESIHKAVAELMSLPNLSLTWQPTRVEVARSGDLGYLYGVYNLSATGPGGKPIADRGKMVEVWKKQADGNWKVVTDIWNSDQSEAAPPK